MTPLRTSMAKRTAKNNDTTPNLGFEAKHAELDAQKTQGADPEDPDAYRAANILWVPKETRWQHLKASAEGKREGQFDTPSHVVRVLVEMLAPYKGRVEDPCCGSGGMFVQSEKFIEAHAGKLGDISIYGQESNSTTWRLAKMNLAIRGIDAQIAHGDTFHNHRHPDLKADDVLANPPFNDSDWRGELLEDDQRWVYGVPPAGNANYAGVEACN
jgi:type I restriction-modification system DNA methylase subunit